MPDSTINGLTAVTGANLDQTADQLPIWVNSASTTRKISRSEFLSGPPVGTMGSAIRAAASDYAAVTFDGATASTRITSTLTNQNIDTGDFSLWTRFRVPRTNPSATCSVIGLSPTSNISANANSTRFSILSTGDLNISFQDGTGALTSGLIAGFVSSFSGQVVDLVGVRTATSLKVYINGVDTPYTGSPTFTTAITSTYLQVGIGSSSTALFPGRIFRAVVFNRALSASDVTEVITTGVNPADQWGTQTQVAGYSPAALNGGFETNTLNVDGSWATSTLGTSTATIDTSGSFSRTGTNAGKFTLDGSGSFANFSLNNSKVNTLALNKRYRISFWARKGSTSGSCGIQFGAVGAGNVYGNTGFTLTTTYANTTVEIVTVTDGGLSIGRLAGSAGGSEIYIDDVEVTRIGAIVDLDFTVGTGYQAQDRSTNNLHGTLFNGVEFTQPKRMAVLYATTSTNGNQQMLGTVAIPTNAVIEDIICNSTGSATVSIGNASAGTQIVNGASVVSGRQKLTLATPFSTTGNLWVNSNSTATLQFTILYTIAS